jgi:glycosyltransferase involved in cell wall biosynthesis
MTETDSFHDSGWTKNCNLMDAVIVPCYSNKQAAITSGVNVPVHIVNLCVDLDLAQKSYPENTFRQQVGKDKFVFYTISEWTQRKNIEDILRAFHLEFAPNEPVELLIKTSPQGMGDNPQRYIGERCDGVKKGLKLYSDIIRYKRENVICNFSSETEINTIHANSDCFVSASHGEACCLPALTAMSFGNTLVVPAYGGFIEYVTAKNSYLVDGREDCVHDCTDSMTNLYTGREKYFYPSLTSLRECMRAAYVKRLLNLKKKQQALSDIKKFSLEAIGLQYKKVLEGVIK